MKDTNRIDHFVWAVRPENVAGYLAQLSDLFHTEFEEYDGKSGARILISWDTGFEFAVPNGEGPRGDDLRAYLDKNGEGLFAVVFRVPDIESASKRAAQLGWPVGDGVLGSEEADKGWTRVTRVREQFIGPFLNTMLLYGQIDYADGDEER
jgi:hypothetical protein